MYHGKTTENHGNVTEMPRKITENHGKSRKITEGFFHANHGNSRIPGQAGDYMLLDQAISRRQDQLHSSIFLHLPLLLLHCSPISPQFRLCPPHCPHFPLFPPFPPFSPIFGFPFSLGNSTGNLSPDLQGTSWACYGDEDTKTEDVIDMDGDMPWGMGCAAGLGTASLSSILTLCFISAISCCALHRYLDWSTASTTCCHRPVSADDVPLIGPYGRISNLYINSGHGSKGWTLAAASGKLLADAVTTGHSADLDLSLFDPNRFSIPVLLQKAIGG